MDGPLLGARDLLGPGAQAGAECIRPLIHHLEDDATAFPSNQDFALSREPTLLREPDRLTATILEELRASRFHCVSLDACLYVVKVALRFGGGAPEGRVFHESQTGCFEKLRRHLTRLAERLPVQEG